MGLRPVFIIRTFPYWLLLVLLSAFSANAASSGFLTPREFCVFNGLDAATSRPPSHSRSTESLSELQAEAASGYARLPKNTHWLALGSAEASTQNLVKELSLLSPADRVRAVSILDAHPPADPGLNQVLRLALYDQNAWYHYVDTLLTGSDTVNSVRNSLLPLFRNMPQDLRSGIARRIHAKYTGLPKGVESQAEGPESVEQTTFGYSYNSPKRSADAMIRYLYGGETKMVNEVSRGSRVEDAYQHYLDGMRAEWTGPERTYSARSILDSARAIQAELKTEAAQLPPGGSITITGSWPNGKARIASDSRVAASDIDFMASDPAIVKLYQLRKQLNRVVAATYASVGQMSHLKLHPMRAWNNLDNATQINPVAIRISVDKIEILVSSPIPYNPNDPNFAADNYPTHITAIPVH